MLNIKISKTANQDNKLTLKILWKIVKIVISTIMLVLVKK